MKFQRLTEKDYVKSVWSGGTSTQYFIYPAHSTLINRDFLFRLSSAKIEVEFSEFSRFNGYTRIFTPLDQSVILQQQGKNSQKVEALEIVEFDGALETTSIGQCTDFNLIFRPEIQAELKVLTLDKEEKLAFDAIVDYDFHIVHLLKGKLNCESEQLFSGETVVFEKESGKVELVSKEQSTVLLSSISLKKD